MRMRITEREELREWRAIGKVLLEASEIGGGELAILHLVENDVLIRSDRLLSIDYRPTHLACYSHCPCCDEPAERVMILFDEFLWLGLGAEALYIGSELFSCDYCGAQWDSPLEASR